MRARHRDARERPAQVAVDLVHDLVRVRVRGRVRVRVRVRIRV